MLRRPALPHLVVPSHLSEESLELAAANPERAEVGAHNILTKVGVHLDDDGTRETRPTHRKVIPALAGNDAIEQEADVTQLLPSDFHRGA